MKLDANTVKAAVYWAEALARGAVPSTDELLDMQETFAAVADAALRRRPSDEPDAAAARQRRRRARLRGGAETEAPPPPPARAEAPPPEPADAPPARHAPVTRDSGVMPRDTAGQGVTPPRFPPFPSPTPPTNNPLPSPPGRLVGGVGGGEPGHGPDDGPPPIVGVVLEPPASTALRWTLAINRGVTATHGEQPVPLRHAAQLEATERLLALGVEEAWAADWLAAEAAKCTRRGIPGSLAAFERRLAAAWHDEVAARTAAAAGDAWAATPGAPAGRAAAGAESDAARTARIRRVAERHVAQQAAERPAAARRASPPRMPPDPTRDAPRTPAPAPVGDVLGALTAFLPRRAKSA